MVHPQGFLIGGHAVFLIVLFIRLFRGRDAVLAWVRHRLERTA